VFDNHFDTAKIDDYSGKNKKIILFEDRGTPISEEELPPPHFTNATLIYFSLDMQHYFFGYYNF
jgi:hypothetical protein